ncbi:hypothetical protein TNIN_247321 [Trichonephila inaurata madagascariensis]|uniref:Uncharacterized protein n=1 Tax=Trichonephila inaurata madagascariensis TaxID=2747483 RepID=A0A8X7CBR5_9ARAC|nr:hypothetical protein TNIN_353811 [Trichonephila inaurata madagascariensis]GFY71066.1 hypothetical protein TNIN_247321 [Trichonephila inaurata madagascariensis]
MFVKRHQIYHSAYLITPHDRTYRIIYHHLGSKPHLQATIFPAEAKGSISRGNLRNIYECLGSSCELIWLCEQSESKSGNSTKLGNMNHSQ